MRGIIGSEKLNDNISEKLKIENLETEIISSLESTISFLFQKKLNISKDKCEKLMQNSCSNYSNESVSRTSREILDDLSQLKSVITKNYQETFLQPAFRVSNGKTALRLHHLKEQFSELNSDFVDNNNIKVKHTGQRGLPLNPKGKGSPNLNIIHKIRVFDSFRDT